MKQIKVKELLNPVHELHLQLMAGGEGLARSVESTDINRPGLALTGFYSNFAENRIQVFGKGEYAYLSESDDLTRERIYKEFFGYQFPAIVFTHNNQPPEELIDCANESSTPLLITDLSTHDFIVRYTNLVTEKLASVIAEHGVLVEVYGIGIFLTGDSGVGKSETALELIERGHRLVADDIVHISCARDQYVYGASSELLEYHMEIRGIGIINIKDLFGLRAVRGRKRIDLVIHLEEWDSEKDYERIGLDQFTRNILGVDIPEMILPVRPGRNIPILVETAAMNQRSRNMGFHSARNFQKNVETKIQQRNKVKPQVLEFYPGTGGPV